MTTDNDQPVDNNDGGGLTPIILAVGLGAAALVLSKGMGDGGGGGTGEDKITLNGSSMCTVGSIGKAQVELHWISNTIDTEYLIEQDGLIIDTVYHGAKSWISNLLPENLQGITHSYRVSGKQSLKASNSKSIKTEVCVDTSPLPKQINSAEVVWN